MAEKVNGRKSGSRWTEAEDRILVECAEAGMGTRQTAERIPNRSRLAIKERGQKLGVQWFDGAYSSKPKDQYGNWSAEEIALLRELYATDMKMADIAKKLNDRTYYDVRNCARKLGLGSKVRTYDSLSRRMNPPYGQKEIAWLRANFGDTARDELDLVEECNEIFHGGENVRTWGSLRTKAYDMRLHRRRCKTRAVFQTMEAELRDICVLKTDEARSQLYSGVSYDDD